MKFKIGKSFILLITFDFVLLMINCYSRHDGRRERRSLSDLTTRTTNWMAKRKYYE